MAGERIGVVIVALLGVWLAARAWARRPLRDSPPRGQPNERAQVASQPDAWFRLATCALVASASAGVVYAWAAVFPRLGATGLTAIGVFLAPVTIGFIHYALRRAPDREGS